MSASGAKRTRFPMGAGAVALVVVRLLTSRVARLERRVNRHELIGGTSRRDAPLVRPEAR
jgi:hypothetical protein